MKKLPFLILLVVFLASCGQDYSGILPGTWQAYSVEEDGQPMELDPAQIQFSFNENGGYTYSGTLNYREAGSYYLEKDLLFTTDTLNSQSVEKVVQVHSQVPDSLTLRMEGNGKEQIIQLFRTGQ